MNQYIFYNIFIMKMCQRFMNYQNCRANVDYYKFNQDANK